jgi:hypothetical protein
VKVRVDKFCTLSTSPPWQAWLYNFDAGLCKRFLKRMSESRGCNQNRDVMIDTLGEIEKLDGGDRLIAFLTQHYPHMLVADTNERVPTQAAQPAGDDEIFGHYNPNILTYPRRLILVGAEHELKRKVQSFLVDKIRSDFVIVGDKAYVEFLNRGDEGVLDKVPVKNWLIAAWRLRTAQK